MYLCEYINGFLLWNEKQLPSVLDTRELQLPSIWDNAPVPVTLGVSTPPVSQTPADHDYPVFQIPGSCNSPVSQIPRSCNSRCPAHRGVDLLLFRLFSQTSSQLYLLTLKQQSIKKQCESIIYYTRTFGSCFKNSLFLIASLVSQTLENHSNRRRCFMRRK